MADRLSQLIELIFGLATGVGVTLLWLRLAGRRSAFDARGRAKQVMADAHSEAQTLRRHATLEAQAEALRRREALDAELEAGRRTLRDQERRLEKREDLFDEKLDLLNRKERECHRLEEIQAQRQAQIEAQRAELDERLGRQRHELQRITGLGPAEARAELFERLEAELTQEIGTRLLRHEQALKEASRQKSVEILSACIQRYAAPHTADTTTSTVDIPSDDMKGRIIGREGRNIRAFEKATGVDLIVDDTPGVVIVSAFDSIRREVARVALEKLILDGRIHPARIEEIVDETSRELDDRILQIGREAAAEAGVAGLDAKLLGALGKLHFRTSYSQNVLRHSIEVACLSGMLAQEIGLDGPLGRRCGLLHDVGKALDHEFEGGHPALGAELVRRHGEGPEVVHAALGHHDDLRIDRPYTVLVAAADAISASRPGARRDTLEKYVRRLEELERLVLGFPGVEQAYAIQAGREVRVLVDSHRIDDATAAKLCRDIARAIEQQLTYPGEVRVTLLRETRSVEYAR